MPQTQLAKEFSNLPKHHEYSPYQRGIIVATRRALGSDRAAAEELKIPKSSVNNTVRADESRHNGESKPRSGRPPVCDDREKRRLLRFVKNNPDATYKDWVKESDVEISRATYLRILKGAGVTNGSTQKQPKPPKGNAAKQPL